MAAGLPVGRAERVVVWPRDPGQRRLAAEAEARLEAAEVVPFAPIAARLDQALARRRAADAAALAEVEAALDRAQTAFVEQRWDDMRAELEAAIARHLAVLARPALRATLWEIELRLGLAHLYRGKRGDRERALERFELALSLDPSRRPSAELYGPDVLASFAEALARRADRTPRPVRLRLRPAGAALTIDGRPLPAGVSAPLLRPGLHVVVAEAIGHRPWAGELALPGEAAAAIELAPGGAGDPVERLAPVWLDRRLDPASAAQRAELVASARALGAEAVLVVEAGGGSVTAWRIDAEGLEVAHAATLGQALRAALAEPLLAGAAAPPGQSEDDGPFYTRAWFWIAVGGLAAASAAGIVAASSSRGPDRIIVDIDR